MLRQTKEYGAKRLLPMFPNKQWSSGSRKKPTRKIDVTGKVDRRSAPGSGRPPMALHALNSGERDMELAWLHREDNLNAVCVISHF